MADLTPEELAFQQSMGLAPAPEATESAPEGASFLPGEVPTEEPQATASIEIDEADLEGIMAGLPAGLQSLGETAMRDTVEASVDTGIPGDVLKGAAGGVVAAVDETSDLAFEAGQWLNKNALDLGYININAESWGDVWENSEEFEARMRSMGADPFDANSVNGLKSGLEEDLMPVTGAGRLAKGVTQFATGMIGAARLLKLPAATTVGGSVARGATLGAAADFTVFDPHEKRAANLFNEYFPSLSNPVSEFLAADKDDTAAMGRFKNVLEGAGLGVTTDLLFQSVRLLRAARSGDATVTKEASEAVEAAAKDAGLDVQKEITSYTPTRPMQMELDLGDVPEPLARSQNPTIMEKPVVTFTEDSARVAGNIAEGSQGHTSREGIDFNFDRMETESDVMSAINAVSARFAKETTAVKGGEVRTFETVAKDAARFADEIGEDPDLFLQRMRNTVGDQHLDATMNAQRTLMVSLHDNLKRMAAAVREDRSHNGVSGTALAQQLQSQARLAVEVQAMYKGQQTNIARALSAMRMKAKPNQALGEALEAVDPEALLVGGSKGARELADRIAAIPEGNLKAMNKGLKGSLGSKVWGVHNEYWINAILSSPKTHAVNSISNAAMMGFMPAERILAGAMTGRGDMVKEGFYQYLGLARSVKDSAKGAFAVLASKEGENILDMRHAVMDPENQLNAISARGFGMKSETAVGTSMDVLGRLIRTPGRALATSDEFFKQMSFRSRVYAKAMREGRAQGMSFGEAAAHAEGRIEKSLEVGGQFNPRSPDAQAGIKAAREATFTQDLEYGIGQSIQNFKGNHPFMGVILPFVRTPTNIIRFTWQRTPVLNMLQKGYMDDLAAGGTRRAEAIGKMGTGLAFWGAATTLALEGQVTGKGPTNVHERKVLEQTGWKPYSFMTTEADGSTTYTSYQRGDPFGMFVGMAADIAETMGRADEQTAGQLALAASASIMTNILSKSYMEGLNNVLQTANDPERRLQGFAERQIGSYVPSGVAALKDDPALREVRSVIESIRSRIPGLSETLDPRRNLLGEVQTVPTGWGPDWVSPFAQGHREGDPVFEAMADLEYAIQPPALKKGNVDLTADEFRTSPTQTAYDRYQELIGTVAPLKKNLRETLTDLVQSDDWDDLTNPTKAPGAKFRGSRIDVVQRILGQFREAAFVTLMEENPSLKAAYLADKLANAKAKVSDDSPLQNLIKF